MLRFRSLRSGSSGNLLLLEGHRRRQRTRLLVDCGIRSQRACVQILEEEVGLSEKVDGLLVTHAHSDHVNYATLRVMDRLRIPIYIHRRTRQEVRQRYLNPYRMPAGVDLSHLEMRSFRDQAFAVNGFNITPVAVPHAPGITTHAFVVRHGRRKILIASDFHDPEAVVPHIYNCDLIYLESNHDPELLRLHFNPASLFHLPNPAASLLLQHTIEQSRKLPRAIVLGHLSEERNRPELALLAVRELLGQGRPHRDLPVLTAPRYAMSQPVSVEG